MAWGGASGMETTTNPTADMSTYSAKPQDAGGDEEERCAAPRSRLRLRLCLLRSTCDARHLILTLFCALSIYGPFPYAGYLKTATAELLGFSSINILLLFTPLAFGAKIVGASDSLTFFFALMALIPLAALLGVVTEELAMYTNQTLGGLMNATFGNATEVIISAIALHAAVPPDFAMLRIVQVSLVRFCLHNTTQHNAFFF